LEPRVRAFLERRRVGHLATADGSGAPHVVPVCFAVLEQTIYSVIDEKPKRSRDARRLRRVANLQANPRSALVVDVYDDQDWSKLGYVLVSGSTRLLQTGEEHTRAVAELRGRYEQYREMQLGASLVIALDIQRVVAWGDLSR
jgi:PPOX class probable F420-dependent enzyme